MLDKAGVRRLQVLPLIPARYRLTSKGLKVKPSNPPTYAVR